MIEIRNVTPEKVLRLLWHIVFMVAFLWVLSFVLAWARWALGMGG